MTDKEITKALDDLIHLGDAPIGKDYGVIVDKQTLKDTLDLISRLKADNERYKATVGTLVVRDDGTVVGILKGSETEYIEKDVAKIFRNMAVRTAKIEAYKEFAERAKEEFPNKYIVWAGGTKSIPYDLFFDNLLKEMGWRGEA